jgi:16S rRNA processing protein RimM
LQSDPRLERGELPADAVEVGRVVGAWGVRGALRIKPHSTAPEALLCTKRWFVHWPEGGPAVPAGSWLLPIHTARAHGEHVIATARDLSDRDAAQSLAGARIFVARSSFPTPAADEYYWVDLIGLAVINREQVMLGTVTDLFETGPTCVLRVRDGRAGEGAEGRERLIPFVAAYVDEVDLEGRRVRVDWQPED